MSDGFAEPLSHWTMADIVTIRRATKRGYPNAAEEAQFATLARPGQYRARLVQKSTLRIFLM